MDDTGRVRTGTGRDVPGIVGLIDESVSWLATQGREEQWGGQPWSLYPARVEHLAALVNEGHLLVVDWKQHPAAAVIFGSTAPKYVPPTDHAELYVHLLVTGARARGRGWAPVCSTVLKPGPAMKAAARCAWIVGTAAIVAWSVTTRTPALPPAPPTTTTAGQGKC